MSVRMTFVYTRARILIEAWEDARTLHAPNNERFATPLLSDNVHECISSTVTWAKPFFLLNFITVFTDFSRAYQNCSKIDIGIELIDFKIYKRKITMKINFIIYVYKRSNVIFKISILISDKYINCQLNLMK